MDQNQISTPLQNVVIKRDKFRSEDRNEKINATLEANRGKF
jgi:hypothetical protein